MGGAWGGVFVCADLKRSLHLIRHLKFLITHYLYIKFIMHIFCRYTNLNLWKHYSVYDEMKGLSIFWDTHIYKHTQTRPPIRTWHKNQCIDKINT